MKTYLLQSDKLPEPVVFKFNSNGFLTSFESTGLTTEQLQWVYSHFPTHVDSIKLIRDKYKIRFQEVKEEIDFERFFANYSTLYGQRVDKKKAESIWERMSKQKQWAAYEYIPNYYARCKRLNVPPKMAKTYLNNEPWNDSI